ncbi:hypothetical protein ACFL1H_07985, partial [Nanoarchaeota archaeon]
MENLIGKIEGFLKEHTVLIQKVQFYLIEVKAESEMLKDFTDTYKDDIDKFKTDLGRNIFGNKKSMQTYGVLINTDLEYVFAFNRKFADLNKNKTNILYKKPEDILLKETPNNDLSTGIEDIVPDFVEYDDPESMTMRYASITGKLPKSGKDKTITINHKSMLDRVIDSFPEAAFKEGEVRYSGYLVDIPYKSKTLDDLKLAYPEIKKDKFKLKLAKEIFKGKEENHYA